VAIRNGVMETMDDVYDPFVSAGINIEMRKILLGYLIKLVFLIP